MMDLGRIKDAIVAAWINFDWSFWGELQYGVGDPHWVLFLKSWGWTFVIAIGAWVLSVIIGALIGTLQTLPSQRPTNRLLSFLGNAWVDVFRNVPILVQMFTWMYVVPVLIPPLSFLREYPIIMAIIALSFFTSTRVAEQVRAAIQSLPSGQYHAALALGLTTKQAYRYILLPIAARVIMPPLTSEAMNIVKNTTAAVVIIGAFELMQFTYDTSGIREDILPQIYFVVTIAFVITSLAFLVVMRWIERKIRIPGVADTPGEDGK